MKRVKVESDGRKFTTRILDENGQMMTTVKAATIKLSADKESEIELVCAFPAIAVEGAATVKWVAADWLFKLIFEEFAKVFRGAYEMYKASTEDEMQEIYTALPTPMESTHNILKAIAAEMGEKNAE